MATHVNLGENPSDKLKAKYVNVRKESNGIWYGDDPPKSSSSSSSSSSSTKPSSSSSSSSTKPSSSGSSSSSSSQQQTQQAPVQQQAAPSSSVTGYRLKMADGSYQDITVAQWGTIYNNTGGDIKKIFPNYVGYEDIKGPMQQSSSSSPTQQTSSQPKTTSTSTSTSTQTQQQTPTSYVAQGSGGLTGGISITPAQYQQLVASGSSTASQFTPVYGGGSNAPTSGTQTGNYVLTRPDGTKQVINKETADAYQSNGLAQGYSVTPEVTGTTPSPTPTPTTNQTPVPTQTETPTIDPTTGEPINPNGTPYFMGNYSLVRFAGQGPNGYLSDDTIWLLDPTTKTFRPFQDSNSINNFFSTPVDINKIQVVPAAALMPGGMFGPKDNEAGYELLPSDFAIKPDGTAKRLDYNRSSLSARYGNEINQDAELNASMLLDGFLAHLGGNADGQIGSGTLNGVKGDNNQLAFYINALAYGGYSLNDVYRDLKKREIGADDVSPISAIRKNSDYFNTEEGKKARTDARLTPPSTIGGLAVKDLELPIANIPEDAFKTLIPILDYDSQQFKDEMNKIVDAYHDILIQQVNATTEQQKAVGDYAWEQFREDLDRRYGIKLSQNAIDAWGQIEQAYNNFAKSNTMNTGIAAESVDDYLRSVRRSDQIARIEKMDEKEAERMNYYQRFATSQQIKDLAQNEPELAKKWGLVPSDEIKQAYSLAALKAKYPDEDEETLQRYIAATLDENGNYRSGLFREKMTDTLKLESDKRLYQQGKVLDKSLRDEEKAYLQFTTPDSPFLRTASYEDDRAEPFLPSQSNEKDNFSNIIKQAGTGISATTLASAPAKSTSSSSTSGGGITEARTALEKIMAQDTQNKQQAPQSNVQNYVTQNAPKTQATGPSTQYAAPIYGSSYVTPVSTPGPAKLNPSLPTGYSSLLAPNYATQTKTSTPVTTNPSSGTLGAIGNALKTGWNTLTSWF